MRKTLKRFERLENTTLSPNFLPDTELQTSKRFSKLEVNDKSFQLTIEDKIAPQESAPEGKEFFFLCPYCGQQNNANVEVCGYCKHQLKNQYISDYAGKVNQLKKCRCGAVNLKERKNCWVCGRDFSLWGDDEVKESPENVIAVTIDGKLYRSTDPDLPEGIVGLIEKIRREGYSEALVNEWMKEKNDKIDRNYVENTSRLEKIRWGIFWRVLAGICVVIFMILELRYCVMARHY